MRKVFSKKKSAARTIAFTALEGLESRTLYSTSAGGSISGVQSAATPTYNLSQLGTSDWAHWGTNGIVNSFVDDATGGGQISNVKRVGTGGFGGWTDSTRSVSWTDGSPAAADSADNGYIWANNGIGAGYSFTVPASTTTQTLYVYLGGFSSGSTLTAHLSDGSAPDYTVNLSSAGHYTNVVAITYKAGSAGQTLTISYTKSQNINGTGGSADLIAAWLAGNAAPHSNPTQPVTPTPPPVVTPPSTGTGSGGAGTLRDGSALPGPTNTGPTNPNILAASGSIVVTTPGAVIQNLAVTGTIEIKAPNVTVKNCTVNANGNYDALQIDKGANNCTIEDTSVTGTGSGGFAIETEAATGNSFLRLNVYNTADQGFHLGGASTVQGCWLHQIGWNAAGIASNPAKPGFNGLDHVEDFFIETGASFTITGNNIQTPDFVTINGVTYGTTTAVFFIDPYSSGDAVRNVTINNNYLDGGGYMFYLMGQGPFALTNNIIGPDEQYGLIYSSYIGGPWSWANNVNQNGGAIATPTGLPVAAS